METGELLSKVRKIEIKTRGLSNQIFSGEYHSVFKGRGMAFSEVREYTPGDDVRAIDWNVTARFGHPYIKVFEEERELTVMLLADVSASGYFGTQVRTKQDMMTEIAAVLAFSAIQNNDKVGIIFFSDRIEKYIPPKKGKSHILRIIRELIDFQPQGTGTNLAEALRYFTNVMKKRCTAFILSDFISADFQDALKIANRKHDVIGVRLHDKHEKEMPDIGLVKVADKETGMSQWIDFGIENNRKQYLVNSLRREEKIKDVLRKSGVDFTQISTNENYVKPLMTLFKRREKLK